MPVADNASRCAPGAPPAERQLTRYNCSLILSILIPLLSVAPAGFARSVTATMNVSVVVVARAIVTVSSQPNAVTVTEADLARGYVDIDTPLSVLVRTNSRAGYLLQVDRGGDAFARVDLTFGDSAMSVAHQAWISRPYVPGGESLQMHARVYLAGGARPGIYPLSLAISAQPL